MRPVKKSHYPNCTYILGILIIFLLSACQIDPESSIKINTPDLESITQSPKPINTISLTPNPVLSATISLVPTLHLSSTITSFSTSTRRPSLTPLPTEPNPQIAIDRLYETNGDCKLPCWWGITPGKTTLEQFRQFFQQFGADIRNESDQTFTVSVFSPGRQNEQPGFTIIKTNKDIVQEINITSDMAAWGGFISSTILSEYGKPDNVYYSPKVPHLFLHYDKQHFLAVYQLTNWEVGGETSLCFLGFTDIWTWSDEVVWSKGYISEKYNMGELETYEETTDLQFQKYYTRLLNGDDYLCSQIK